MVLPGCASDCCRNTLYGLYTTTFESLRGRNHVRPVAGGCGGCDLERGAVALAISDSSRGLPKRSSDHFARLVLLAGPA
jgi:hypothetical protein